MPVAILSLVACVSSPPAQDIDRVTVRIQVSEQPEEPLLVQLSGNFGKAEGRELGMAPGMPGAYQTFSFLPHVHNLRAWNHLRQVLDVERDPDTSRWRISGLGELALVEYEVDTAGADRSIGDPNVLSRRGPGYAWLNGYQILLTMPGDHQVPHVVDLVLPHGWAVATSLPKTSEGFWRAQNAFEFRDEPLLLGNGFLHQKIGEAEPARNVYVQAAPGVRGTAILGRLTRAARHSVAGIQALGLPGPRRPYAMLFDVQYPPDGSDWNWALEHGHSFHSLHGPSLLEWSDSRLIYHMIHHQLHAWVPRRLYTDQLHPIRQLNAEVSQFLWFAEGFPQYLAVCALAKSKGVDRKTALTLFAERFAKVYADRPHQSRMAPSRLSEVLCQGDHRYLDVQYATGALLALWMDSELRRETPERGLVEVLRDLSRDWADHPHGIPEDEFVDILSDLGKYDFRPIFEKHIFANRPLPLDLILERVGIVQDGAEFIVLPDAEVSQQVRLLRHLSF